MSKDKAGDFEIFLQAAPGLEEALLAEVRTHRFKASKAVPGGVTVRGGWREVWKANLELRGAGRVNAHLATFRAPTLAELEKRAAPASSAATDRSGAATSPSSASTPILPSSRFMGLPLLAGTSKGTLREPARGATGPRPR